MNWLLLSAGRGPGECQIALRGLLKVLTDEARQAGVEIDLLEAEEGPHGLLSALVGLRGDGADSLAMSWEGTLRWICPSPLRPGWARKNWFVGVTRLSPPPPATILREADLHYETCRASGPGGQHVNKTDSAVRVTHRPTGLTAQAREERSQHRNKALALARLAEMLAQRRQQQETEAVRTRWERHDALERGNAVRTYEGPSFRRVAGA